MGTSTVLSEERSEDVATLHSNQQTTGSRSSPKRFAGWLTVLAALPLFVIQCVVCWREPGLEFSVFFVAASLMLWWIRWPKKGVEGGAEESLGSVVLAGIGLTLVACSVLLYSPPLGALAFCAAMLGRGLKAAGNPQQKADQLRMSVLLIVVTLSPSVIEYAGKAAVQDRATSLASYFLDLAGIHHQVLQGVFYLVEDRFYVLQLCEGVEPWSFFLGLAAFIAVLHRMNWLQLAIFVSASYVWAVLFDAGRMVGKIVCESRMDMSLTGSMLPILIDLAVGGGLFLLMYSAFHVLRLLLNPIPEPSRAAGASKGWFNPYSGLWNKLLISPLQRMNPRAAVKRRETDSARRYSALMMPINIVAGLLLAWQVSSLGAEGLQGKPIVLSPDQIQEARATSGRVSIEDLPAEDRQALNDMLECMATGVEIEREIAPGEAGKEQIQSRWSLEAESANVDVRADFPYTAPFARAIDRDTSEDLVLADVQLQSGKEQVQKYVLLDDGTYSFILQAFVASAGEKNGEDAQAWSVLWSQLLPVAQNPFLVFVPLGDPSGKSARTTAPRWACIRMIHRSEEPLEFERERHLVNIFQQMVANRCGD